MKFCINIICLTATILILFSCEKKEELHSDLIYFKAKYIAELGDKGYDKYYGKFIEPNIQYLDDIIFIQSIVQVNACGQYGGNIKITNDSIILQYKLVYDELCMSIRVEKLTYIIQNPENKKYKFRFE